MTIHPQLMVAVERRHAFEDLAIQLLFALEGEMQANSAFTLPEWIVPTFDAAKPPWAAWNQAAGALAETAEPPQSKDYVLEPPPHPA